MLLFVGVSAIGLSAPAPFLGLDLCETWPGVIASWWLMLSRALSLAVVWRVAVLTLVGFESTCVLTAFAINSHQGSTPATMASDTPPATEGATTLPSITAPTGRAPGSVSSGSGNTS